MTFKQGYLTRLSVSIDGGQSRKGSYLGVHTSGSHSRPNLVSKEPFKWAQNNRICRTSAASFLVSGRQSYSRSPPGRRDDGQVGGLAKWKQHSSNRITEIIIEFFRISWWWKRVLWKWIRSSPYWQSWKFFLKIKHIYIYLLNCIKACWFYYAASI